MVFIGHTNTLSPIGLTLKRRYILHTPSNIYTQYLLSRDKQGYLRPLYTTNPKRYANKTIKTVVGTHFILWPKSLFPYAWVAEEQASTVIYMHSAISYFVLYIIGIRCFIRRLNSRESIWLAHISKSSRGPRRTVAMREKFEGLFQFLKANKWS